MKTAARGAGSEGRPQRGVCVLCGLPAAGKSTLARALGQRLRRERGWAVGVLSYDDVLPDTILAGDGAPSRWKLLRHELLKYLECFLAAVSNGCRMSAPPGSTEAVWTDFTACLHAQDLVQPAAPEPRAGYPLTKTAASRPLLLLLDDNFYYQSMRYEVYQLARKYSLGFCQLFLDCPLETCLQRNGLRPLALPTETIRLMASRIERPNPEKNSWERHSLTIQGPACSPEARPLRFPGCCSDGLGSYDEGFSFFHPVCPEVTDLLLTAMEHPVKHTEENVAQKEADRIICSANILHKADQTLRRVVSEIMKEAKDEQVPPSSMKLLAEELNTLKAEFLEDLRQGNKKRLCFQQTTDVSDIISDFHHEKQNIVQKYLSKSH